VDIFARTCNYDVMDSERIAARLFVGLGGLLWVVLAIGSAVVYPSGVAGMDQIGPFLVLALAVLALLVGWFYENLAALLLFAGAVATVVWGVMAGWEAGVWGLMVFFLIGPEILAGVLFLAAARMQKACEEAMGK
jgi:fatty acid desaturase